MYGIKTTSRGMHSKRRSIVRCKRDCSCATKALLHLTAAPLGRRTVQIIWQRLLQPTGCFRQRSLNWSLSH
jgi:hypothetical protein